MRRDGFFALLGTRKCRPFDRGSRLLDRALASATACYVEVKTRSGRVFRYNLSDYRFGPDFTPHQAQALAMQIAKEKYKECEWDRGHPRVAAEAEIEEAVYMLVLKAVDRMRSEETQPSE